MKLPPPVRGLVFRSEKVYFTHQSMGVGTHHPEPIKMDFLPTELSKMRQIAPDVALDNHNKLQKIIK
jgi:hypothetical protein